MVEKNFQVCASCINFEANKKESGMIYRCKRLGYETKPSYSFKCWNPKSNVKRLMEKRKQEIEQNRK